MMKTLTRIADAEAVRHEEGALQRILDLSGGDMRRAITTMQSAHALSGGGGGGGGGEGEGEGVLEVPRLACQLHPWVQPSIRRSAVLRLAAVLLGAWRRGVHDPVLVRINLHAHREV